MGLTLGDDGPGSVALSPLHSQGEKLGVLELCTRCSRDASQLQLPSLSLVCAQAALVVQRAALCHRLAQMGEEERLLRRYYEKMVASSPVAMESIDFVCNQHC